MIRRTLTYEAKIYCSVQDEMPDPVPEGYCSDNSYESVWKDFVATEDMKIFPESLDIWKENMLKDEKGALAIIGEKKCSDLSDSLHICSYELRNIEAKEEIIGIKIPQDVLDRIERLEDLIVDSKNTIVEYDNMIADILAKKEEERTVEDKEKLIRLDGYVRSENESIRKFESEIRRLKESWKVE